MDEQLTIRLPGDLKRALDDAARRLHRKNAEVVRMALRAYLRVETTGKPADRVRSLFGSVESGIPDLAERHREYVLESLRRGR